MIKLSVIIKHCREREYMANVARDDARVKVTGEIFTPTPLVEQILTLLEKNNPNVFKDKSKTFIDPCCGDGQFLSEVLIKKLENCIDDNGCVSENDLLQCLSTIYGIDIMADNVYECRERLSGYYKESAAIKEVIEKNIKIADSLQSDYDQLFKHE